MFSFALKRRRATLRQARQSSRRLLLESLEDRVVPSQLQDGWLVVDSIGGPSGSGLYAVNPSDGNFYTISVGGPDFQTPVGVAEDPSSGMLYVGEDGPVRSDNFFLKVPKGSMTDHAVIQVDPNTSNPAANSGIQSRVTYDDPSYGENLYGTTGVVYLNGNIYVTNQGDGGGNLHLLVNVDDTNNPQAYDPVTHDVVRIDLNTSMQTPIYNDHQGTVPRDPINHPDSFAHYPTGSNPNGYPDLTKSLDDEEDPRPGQHSIDPEFGYDTSNDPSSDNNPPGWINVPTDISPVYMPNGTLDANHVYVADQQGPDDYPQPGTTLGYNESDPDLSGYIWKVDLTATNSAQAIIPAFNSNRNAYDFTRTQNITVDPNNGNIIVVGFKSFDDSHPVIAVYDPTSYQLVNFGAGTLNPYTDSSNTLPIATSAITVAGPGQNYGDAWYLGVSSGPSAGDIWYVDPSNTNNPISRLVNHSSGLNAIEKMIVYHVPPRLANYVNFETRDFSQAAAHSNGAIVSSPVLDANGPYSLQLLRNNSVANVEIRQGGTHYYNLPTAYYSFLF